MFLNTAELPPSPAEPAAEPQHEVLVTGRHTTPHRELETPLPHGSLLLIDSPASCVVKIPPSEDHCLCLIPLAGEGGFFHDGAETPLAGLSISPFGKGGIFHCAAAGSFAVLSLEKTLARSLAKFDALLCKNKVRVFAGAKLPPAFHTSPHGRPPVIESPLANDLARHAASLEILLLESLNPGSKCLDTQSGPRRISARAEIVHSIWAMLHADASLDLPLEEWSLIVECSPRTLEYAFAQLTGLSPMAFIRSWRFERARGLLLQGRVKTVKDAAFGCGLMHLGRFSVDYRLRFGESPSQTLAANRPKPPIEFALAKNISETEIVSPTETLSSSG